MQLQALKVAARLGDLTTAEIFFDKLMKDPGSDLSRSFGILLSEIKAKDRNKLPPSTIRQLGTMLLSSRFIALHRPILEALLHIGTDESILQIKQFGDKLEWRHRQGICDAERECIPIAEAAVKSIEIHLNRERVSQSLLRPSQAESDQGILLKPAAGPNESKAEELLRPLRTGDQCISASHVPIAPR